MVEFSQSDYVIVEVKGENSVSRKLIKVLSSKVGKSFEGVTSNLYHIPSLRQLGTFKTKDVIINLGPDPYPGKVFGVSTMEVYKGRKEHPDFGTINFFYRPPKDVTEALFKAFDRVAAVLKKTKLDFLLEDLVWEVLPFVGQKYAGMYIHRRRGKEKDISPPRIQINPEIMPATEYVYVIWHELAHHIHTEFVQSKKLNALWVRLFNTSIKRVDITKDDSKRLFETMIDGEDNPSNFRSGLEEDDALTYKWIMRTIQQDSSLSIKELDLLFDADMRDDIKDIWPFKAISRKELAPVISEYATKNHRETLAESVAYYFTKKKLPANVVKLVEKTLSHAKANGNS